MVRGPSAARSVVQGESDPASRSRKKRCYAGAMSVNSTHPDYDASLPAWLRARDVIAGEDAVKTVGEKYLPRRDAQTDEEYDACRPRASLFNATARTADGYLGLLFRRPPFIKVSEGTSTLGKAIGAFVNDADMLGTSLANYALTRCGNAWSSPDVGIKHSYLSGLEKVDSGCHSDTMGGGRFRR